jgi:hypothetical protein
MQYSFDVLAPLARGSLLFKSFTVLTVPEFDVIAKEIESKFEEHERKRLSNRKRERDVGAAGRSFKLIVKERFFLMLLVYYFRLYLHCQDFYSILTGAMSAGIYIYNRSSC